MADVKPNPEVEKARIRMRIANLKATIERQRFEILEMEDRMGKNRENIVATELSIVDQQTILDEMGSTKEKGADNG